MTGLKQATDDFKELSGKIDDVVTGPEYADVLVNGAAVPTIRKQVKTHFDTAFPKINTLARSKATAAVAASKKAENARKQMAISIESSIHEMLELKEDSRLSELMSNLQGAAALLSAKISEGNNSQSQDALNEIAGIAQQINGYLNQVLAAKNETDTNKESVLALKSDCEEILQSVGDIRLAVVEILTDVENTRDESNGHLSNVLNIQSVVTGMLKKTVDAASESKQSKQIVVNAIAESKAEMLELHESARLSELMSNLQGAAAIISAQIAESNNADIKNVMKQLFGKVLSGTLTQDDVNNI